jgi:hypothetical protein
MKLTSTARQMQKMAATDYCTLRICSPTSEASGQGILQSMKESAKMAPNTPRGKWSSGRTRPRGYLRYRGRRPSRLPTRRGRETNLVSDCSSARPPVSLFIDSSYSFVRLPNPARSSPMSPLAPCPLPLLSPFCPL